MVYSLPGREMYLIPFAERGKNVLFSAAEICRKKGIFH